MGQRIEQTIGRCNMRNEKAEQKVRKAIQKTWMQIYDLNPSLDSLSDDELHAEYQSYPKVINNLSESDKEHLAQLYMEILYRRELSKAQSSNNESEKYAHFEKQGTWDDGEPFPSPGDRVRTLNPSSFGGMPIPVDGVVKKKKDGTYYVQITSQYTSGAKRVPLTQRWGIIKESFQIKENKRVASLDTFERNAKIRRSYAYRAIERQSLSENPEKAKIADEAMERFTSGTMSKKKEVEWAIEERVWRIMNESEVRKGIKSILLEFSSNEIIYLAKYLRMSDEAKAENLTYTFSYEFLDFWNDFDYEEEGVSEEEYEKINKMIEEYQDEIYSVVDELRESNPNIVQAYGEWLFENLENGKDFGDPYRLPSWYYMEYVSSFRNGWLIHFTDNAMDVAEAGFKYGMEDMTQLGLTTWMNNDSFDKKYGGYNFAYMLDRRMKEDAYGNEAVMFRASGIEVYHNGDEEYQAIFKGTEARNRVPILHSKGEYYVNDLVSGRRIYSADDIDKVTAWVVENFVQYHKRIAFDK